jgi:hypothetical protein
MVNEQYTNLASTALSGAIDASATTIGVTGTGNAPFVMPTSPQFRVRIGDELLLVTAISSLLWTVQRGIEGSTPASHGDHAAVKHILTADGLMSVSSRTSTAGSYDTRPTSGQIGHQFWPVGGHYLERYNGSAWQSMGPINQLTPPNIADFSWFNQISNSATGSYTVTSGGIYILAPAQAGGESPRVLEVTTPATPWTLTTYLVPLGFPANFWEAGLRLRDSVGGKSVIMQMGYNSGLGFSIDKFNADLTYNASYGTYPTLGLTANWAVPPQWMQLSDNGTNRIWRLSSDGVNWLQVHSVSRTDFVTPNRVGFFANTINPTYDMGILCLSWKIT